MPRKSRTPAPPRRIQAPKARGHERDPAARRRLILLTVAAVAGLAVLAGAVALIAMAASGPSAADALEEAGCTLEAQPGQEARHITEPDAKFKYNTDPPTSGPHHPSQPPFDFYTEPVEQYRLLHNLEHGGVVIQYGEDVPEETVNALREWWLEDPAGILVAPYAKLGDQISLAAWTADEVELGDEARNERGHLARCPTFEAAAFDAFEEEFGLRGPERYEGDDPAMQPGLAG